MSRRRDLPALPPLDPYQRYTIDETSDYLRASRARVYAKIAAGELTILKDGRRTYVPGTSIIAASRAT